MGVVKGAKAPNIPAASLCLTQPELDKPPPQVSDSQDTPTCGLAGITAMDPLTQRTHQRSWQGGGGEAFILMDTPALVSSLVHTSEADGLEAGH